MEPRLLLAFLCVLVACVAATASQPNILLIVSDDQGWPDFGCTGLNKKIDTPNLDRLAAEGVRATHFYVTKEKTLGVLLKSAGYRAGMVGKWDMGQAKRYLPMQRGFDFF